MQNTFERGTEKLDSKDVHLLAETSLFSSETFQCELERKAHTILYTAFVSNRLENFGCYPKNKPFRGILQLYVALDSWLRGLFFLHQLQLPVN